MVFFRKFFEQRPYVLLGLVAFFAGLIAFKPSEPFLVAFLTCLKGLTRDQVTDDVYPVWTYSYLGLLPLLSVLAEVAGYRQVVLLGVLGRVATLLVLLLPFSYCSVALMQLTQATIAAGFAAHPALTAILFRTLPAHAYARATGFTAAAGVVAEVTSSLLGQLMLEGGAPLASLFVVSLASTCAAAA